MHCFLKKICLQCLTSTRFSPLEISVPLQIENEECCTQLDTGCALSLAPVAFYEKFCSHIPLTPTAVKLSAVRILLKRFNLWTKSMLLGHTLELSIPSHYGL